MSHKEEILSVLSQISTKGPSKSNEESILSYTRKWVNLVNRGGLTTVGDDVYLAFQALEIAVKEFLGRSIPSQKKDKQQVIEYISNDEDVQFFWSCVTGTISEEGAQELLKAIVNLWITIRGFARAAAYMEAYKISKDKVTGKSKSLRKELKRAEVAKDE